MNKTNEQIWQYRNRLIDTENKLMVAREEVDGAMSKINKWGRRRAANFHL